MSDLQTLDEARDGERQRVIARIDRHRAGMHESLHELQRPLRTVQRWQRSAQSVLPILPGALLIGGVAWLLLRVLRGRPARSESPIVTQRGGGWFSALLRVATAYRIAVQVRAMLQAGPPGQSLPRPLLAPAAGATPPGKFSP